MRPSFVVYLLLLSLFLTKARGIRLEKGSFVARQRKQHDEESNLLKRNNSGDEEAIPCKEKQCTGKIKKYRKLFITAASAPHAISKNMKTGGNDKLNGKEEEIKVNKQQEEHLREDFVDLTDMDYSPARRKTPIHN